MSLLLYVGCNEDRSRDELSSVQVLADSFSLPIGSLDEPAAARTWAGS